LWPRNNYFILKKHMNIQLNLSRKNTQQAGIFVVLTVAVFFLSKIAITAPFRLQMTMGALLVLGLYSYLNRGKESIQTTDTFIYLLTLFALFLISATGWFISPFFFLLYLLAILLGFLFEPIVSIIFVGTLVVLFSLNIGEVDITYDFLVILSLLSVVPLSLYLRKKYLELKSLEKEILILRKDKQKTENVVEDLLSNTMINFATEIRQPINDTKQLTYRIKEIQKNKEIATLADRVMSSSDEALRIVKKFEEDATGKKLLVTTRTASPSQ
jgi:hypothetical protein